MSKNHRKNLEKAFGKKTKYTAENLHDDHDLFDARRSKNLDDSQYESLLHESGNYKKSVQAHDFDEDDLYAGKKVTKNDLFNFEDNNEDGLEDESIDSDIEGSLPEIKGPIKKENFNVDQLLSELDKEDKDVLGNDHNRAEELKKARAVKEQQNLLDKLVEGRVKMQDLLKLTNAFPDPSIYQHLKEGENKSRIEEYQLDIEIELLDLLDLIEEILVEHHKRLNEDSEVLKKRRYCASIQDQLREKNINRKKFMKNYEIDSDSIWNELDQQFEGHMPYVDKSISNWAQKFNLLTQSSLKGKFANIFQTPIQQTQKVMEDYSRLLKRSQVRDSTADTSFKSDPASAHDEESYNDDDFFLNLFRDMLQRQSQAQEEEEDPDGLLVETTRSYLKKKMLQSKPRKLVDRRASKNRKLRYDTHAKLVNFVAPIENNFLLPGRDEILKNLFGLFERPDEEPDEPKVQKLDKKKKSKKMVEEEDEIKLF